MNKKRVMKYEEREKYEEAIVNRFGECATTYRAQTKSCDALLSLSQSVFLESLFDV